MRDDVREKLGEVEVETVEFALTDTQADSDMDLHVTVGTDDSVSDVQADRDGETDVDGDAPTVMMVAVEETEGEAVVEVDPVLLDVLVAMFVVTLKAKTRSNRGREPGGAIPTATRSPLNNDGAASREPKKNLGGSFGRRLPPKTAGVGGNVGRPELV